MDLLQYIKFWGQSIQFKMIFNWNLKTLLSSWLEDYFLIFYKWWYSQHCFDVAERWRNWRWKWKHCFEVALQCSNQQWTVGLTLFNIWNSNLDTRNVVSTLIWHCSMLQIPTLKCAMLFQQWFDVVRRRDVI